MWAGPMRMRLRLGFALALLAGPVVAEPAGCDALLAAVEGAVGLPLSGPPAAMADGWCVLDGARSPGDGDLRVSVERLRVRGEADGAALRALEVDGEGVRVAPALSNRDMAGWLRDLMRLQSANGHRNHVY